MFWPVAQLLLLPLLLFMLCLLLVRLSMLFMHNTWVLTCLLHIFVRLLWVKCMLLLLLLVVVMVMVWLLFLLLLPPLLRHISGWGV
jgi:hypothetical protein